MNKYFCIIIYCFFVLSSSAQADRRFLIWNKNEMIVQSWKKISIDVAENIQYLPKENVLNQMYAELVLLHQAEKWFEYGAGFRVSKANINPGWLHENKQCCSQTSQNNTITVPLSFQIALNTEHLKMICTILGTGRNLDLIFRN